MSAFFARTGFLSGYSRSLGLLFGDRYNQTVEIFGDFDLARQSRIRTHVVAKVEHVLFHGRRTADLLAPGFIDIDMTGGARAGAAAFGLYPRNVVADRRFHHGRAEFGFDRAAGAARVVVRDLGHWKSSGKDFVGDDAGLYIIIPGTAPSPNHSMRCMAAISMRTSATACAN